MLKRVFIRGVPLLLALIIGSVFQPFAFVPALAQPGCQTFKETGKSVCGRFLEYWQKNGGLAQQGLPLTGEFVEVNDQNGKSYMVQYFERAVFEKHPENAAPFDVLLSQLGTMQLKRKYPNGAPIIMTTLPPGQWGGKGIGLSMDGKEIRLEYDCANGMINGTSISLDADGRFDAQGTHTFHYPNSERPTALHATRYTGTVKGDVMTITLTVSNAPFAPGQQVLGPFTLTLNQAPVIRRCQ